MNFDDESRTRILVDVKLDNDPTGQAIDYKVDGTWYACTWLGSPILVDGKWYQTARTVKWFCGPAATSQAGDVVLTLGRHYTETRLNGDDTIVAASSPIDIRT